jgi:hypothetical protein
MDGGGGEGGKSVSRIETPRFKVQLQGVCSLYDTNDALRGMRLTVFNGLYGTMYPVTSSKLSETDERDLFCFYFWSSRILNLESCEPKSNQVPVTAV